MLKEVTASARWLLARRLPSSNLRMRKTGIAISSQVKLAHQDSNLDLTLRVQRLFPLSYAPVLHLVQPQAVGRG